MSAIDIIKRRLKEDHIPEAPEDVGEKEAAPRSRLHGREPLLSVRQVPGVLSGPAH